MSENDARKAFADAMEAAARGAAPGDPWEQLAARVLGARRRGTQHACPAGARRRVESLLRERPRGARFLELVFDSLVDALPATARGTAEARRLLFRGPDTDLELRVEPRQDGTVRLDAALSPAGTAELRYVVPPARRVRRVELDASGIGSARVGAKAREVVFIVVRGGEEQFRTARVHLRAP